MLLVMTGPQATDRPYTSPSTVAQRLQRGGIRIYPVAVGGRVNQAEVLSFTPHADDVTYVPSYPQLNTAAATIAPAVAQGKTKGVLSVKLIKVFCILTLLSASCIAADVYYFFHSHQILALCFIILHI